MPQAWPHPRAEIRLEVRAQAVFTHAGGRGRATVRNLSAGGVEIRDPEPLLAVGSQARIDLIADGASLRGLEGEVVRHSDYGLAFRFTNVDPERRTEILLALQRM